MSHFTRIATAIVEKKFLLAALEKLQYSYTEGKQFVIGHGGIREEVEIKLAGNEIGFKKTGKGYDIIADWYCIKDKSAQEFSGEVKREYALFSLKEKIDAARYTIVSETFSKEKNSHHLIVRI